MDVSQLFLMQSYIPTDLRGFRLREFGLFLSNSHIKTKATLLATPAALPYRGCLRPRYLPAR